MLIWNPRRSGVVATAHELDPLNDCCSIQGFDGDSPWRKLDHLSPTQHLIAEQFPYSRDWKEKPRASIPYVRRMTRTSPPSPKRYPAARRRCGGRTESARQTTAK